MAKYTFVVLTNPTAGKEAEYNDWYNNVHIPDVLNVKGMVGAQRFKLADTQMGAAPAHRYLAIYEIETDNLQETFDDLKSRSGTEDMVLTDAIDLKGAVASIFTPAADKVWAKDVARPRRAAAKAA